MNRVRHAVLAWGLLLTLVGSLYSGVFLPLNERRNAAAERLELLVDRAARVRSLIREQDALSADVQDLKQRLAAAESQYVMAPAVSVATATLQQIATETISESGANQTSIQPLSPEKDGDFMKLSLSAQVEGSYASVHELLKEIEHGSPRIFVAELSLQTRDRNTRRLQRSLNVGLNKQDSDPADVSARLKLVAYTSEH